MTKTKVRVVRYVLYGLLVLALTVLLGYGLVVRPLQIRHQKQNFAKAESSLDELEKQIEATIGKPDAIKKEKSCNRANLLSEKGPLGCSITITLNFSNKSPDQSTNFMNQIKALHNKPLRIGSGATSGATFKNAELARGTQTYYQSIPLAQNLSCSIGYNYSSSTQPYFGLDISCSGSAMAEYYPVNK